MSNPIIHPIIDFDEFVNGPWYNNNEIPPDHAEWGTFDLLINHNESKIISILNNISNNPNHPGNSVGLLFNRLLNTNESDDLKNITRLKKYLDLIDTISNLSDLGKITGLYTNIGINPFFNLFTNEDPKDTSKVKLTICPIELCLPDKTYYNDPSMNDYIVKFKSHITDIFKIFGYDNQNDNQNESSMANDFIKIESTISLVLQSPDKARDLDKSYFKTTIEGFISIMADTQCKIEKYSKNHSIHVETKNIREMWTNYFKHSGLSAVDEIVIYDISYLRKISVIIQMMDLSKIKNYIKYLVIKSLSCCIINKVDKLMFDFYGNVIHGQTIETKKITRIIDWLNDNKIIGEIIGKEYIDLYFDHESKKYVKDIIAKIKDQMRLSILKSDWMTESTKYNALLKLNTFKSKIGSTDNWRSHTKLTNYLKNKLDNNDSLIDITVLINVYTYKTEILDLVDTNYDPDKWSMNPHEINAYYDPHRNEIVFPAGILQKPFFDKTQSPNINFGMIGVIIGHEIIHGFDDQGRKYDHTGKLKNWWDDISLKNYDGISKKLIDQYNKYSLYGKNVNGKLTLGENIADLCGVSLSLKALKQYYSDKSVNIRVNDIQEYFMSYAKIWRTKTRKEKTIANILSNPHSPSKFRIFVLRNIDEFYQVFNIDNSSPMSMYLEPKSRIVLY